MWSQETVTYWYSESHERHIRSMYRKVVLNTVNLDGVWHEYTTCRSDEERDVEPFKEALKRFPDYKIVGTTQGYPVRIGKREWEYGYYFGRFAFGRRDSDSIL